MSGRADLCACDFDRYYYAVATFSSVSAASYIHAECEGTEFERTANMFDLRFVPEEMEFDQEFRSVHDTSEGSPSSEALITLSRLSSDAGTRQPRHLHSTRVSTL